MVLCPTCGARQSLRLPGGKRECSHCGRVYELPRPQKRRSTYTRRSIVDAPSKPQDETED